MAKGEMTDALSFCAKEVRQHDWDRFIFTLFAPGKVRDDLFTFLAFNSELARTREMVREPLMGEIRLKWWQDAIDGIYDGTLDIVQGHYVLENLPRVIREHGLTKGLINQLIDARSADLFDQPPKDERVLVKYALGTSAALNLLLLEILGAKEVLYDKASNLGIAWALTGLMRALPRLAEQGRSPLPLTLITTERNLEEFNDEVRQAVRSVCILAEEYFAKSQTSNVQVEVSHRPVFLSSILTSHYLKQLAKSGYNPFLQNNKRGRIVNQLKVGIGALLGRY